MKRQRNRRNLDRVVRWAIRIFKCDTARVTAPMRKKFLVIGWNKRSEGQWQNQDGEPQNFDYVQESVIASGWTGDSLQRSARRYRRLLSANNKMSFGAERRKLRRLVGAFWSLPSARKKDEISC